SPFEDATIAFAAWLTLAWTWFHVPLWVMAREVPYAAAVIDRGGRVHRGSDEAREPAFRVWYLTDHRGTRIGDNGIGTVSPSSLEFEYRFAESYIATRRDNEDLSGPLKVAASAILRQQAAQPRAARIAFIENRAVRDRVLESICQAAVGDGFACPL